MLSACVLILALAMGAPAGAHFRRGDSNHDKQINLADAISILGFIFLNSPTSLVCEDASDVNDTGDIDIADAIYLLNHLFLGGPPPAAPYPIFEADPTEDELGSVLLTPSCDRALTLRDDARSASPCISRRAAVWAPLESHALSPQGRRRASWEEKVTEDGDRVGEVDDPFAARVEETHVS